MKFTHSIKKEDRRKAILATLIFIMIMILFFLLVSLDEPDPPLAEEIIEIEMEFGSEPDGGSAAAANASQEVTNVTPPSAVEQATQEESTVVVTSGKGNSETSTSTNTSTETTTVNEEFSFGGNGGTTGGNGNGTGFGDGNGVGGNGSGNTPGDGEGTKNLNRKVTDFGGITAKADEEGKIALDIWVDEKGAVVRTKFKASKSTSPSENLIKLATKWAYTMEYEKLLGAPTQYVGYQIFTFKNQ
jgi:hypothetical protein